MSYSDPAGTQIPISVVELVASRPHPVGDIVLNPGGPGLSGVQFLRESRHIFPASLRARFTLVSFDPRGVGSSEPLRCLTAAETRAWISLNPAPSTPQQIHHAVSARKAFVRDCEQSASTRLISSMSTANNARDMDRLRVALDQSRLTYYGSSYGTYLGMVYAEMFPRNVRAMVFDGPIDPRFIYSETSEAQQVVGYETDLHDFLAWWAKCSSCSRSFPRPPARGYAALMAHFKRGLVIPAHLGALGGREAVGYGTALLGVIAELGSKENWPYLADALAEAEKGDGGSLAVYAYASYGVQADGSFSNYRFANTATWCLDWPAPTTIRAYQTLATQLAKSAPDFGAWEAWSRLTCRYWPARAGTHPGPVHASGAPPILVIGSTRDPATPYAWAKDLTTQLPRATLLTRSGAGHTAYQFSSCVRKWADRYLETLKMPPAETVCPSN